MPETKTEREEFLDTIITTAIECSSLHGIRYWADVHSYKWQNGPTTATIEEMEEDGVTGTGNVFHLNREMIAKALEKIIAEKMVSKRLMGAIVAEDAGDIDSDGADCIVQVACLGDIVYG